MSGSFPAVLAPLAQRLGVDHLLATTLESVGGRYTGEILPPQTIGAGKADAIAAFLRSKEAEAQDSYAYGDDISDLPMLEAVGHPTVVAGDCTLLAHAHRAGWPVLRPK